MFRRLDNKIETDNIDCICISTNTITMKTRSGKIYIPNPILNAKDTQSIYHDDGIYEVCIDFDDASREWLRNKRKLRDCTYVYRCVYVTRSNRQCTGTSMPNNCYCCLLYTSPSPRDRQKSRMPSSA